MRTTVAHAVREALLWAGQGNGGVGAAQCLCGDPALVFCLKLGDKRTLGLNPQPSPRCTYRKVPNRPLSTHPPDNPGIPTFPLNETTLA